MKKILLLVISLLICLFFDTAKSERTIKVEPPYPEGGYEAIQEKIEYPAIGVMACIEGRIWIKAEIDSVGNVVSVKIISGLTPDLDQATITAIKSAKWISATADGKSVSSKIKIPVCFFLVDDPEKERMVSETATPEFIGLPIVVTHQKYRLDY